MNNSPSSRRVSFDGTVISIEKADAGYGLVNFT